MTLPSPLFSIVNAARTLMKAIQVRRGELRGVRFCSDARSRWAGCCTCIALLLPTVFLQHVPHLIKLLTLFVPCLCRAVAAPALYSPGPRMCT